MFQDLPIECIFSIFEYIEEKDWIEFENVSLQFYISISRLRWKYFNERLDSLRFIFIDSLKEAFKFDKEFVKSLNLKFPKYPTISFFKNIVSEVCRHNGLYFHFKLVDISSKAICKFKIGFDIIEGREESNLIRLLINLSSTSLNQDYYQLLTNCLKTEIEDYSFELIKL